MRSTKAIRAGNIYVNRNQIGAVVGCQPFGGEGLSGTGPKAGGPDYLARFCAPVSAGSPVTASAPEGAHDLPGPTGETNRLSLTPRAPLLCLGPGPETAKAQAEAVRALGGQATIPATAMSPDALASAPDIAGAILWADDTTARPYALALSRRDGPILPLITAMPDRAHVMLERHVCADTTASGGNAALLAEAGSA